jgi:hypothetical protein
MAKGKKKKKKMDLIYMALLANKTAQAKLQVVCNDMDLGTLLKLKQLKRLES